jgi:hypothetical protein
MAGGVQAKGGVTCLDGELARAGARKHGPRDEEVAATGRSKGVSAASGSRDFGDHAAALLPRRAFRRSVSPHASKGEKDKSSTRAAARERKTACDERIAAGRQTMNELPNQQ